MKDFKLLSVKGSWNEILDAARNTVSKEGLNKEPSKKFKRGILIAEHSPIRSRLFKWKWKNLPSFCATHFARHHSGFEKWISSQRNDRQNKYDRESAPQNAPVSFIGEANTQALINMSRVRLCFSADPTTRKKMEELKKEIRQADEEIAWAMVPSCIRAFGCVEEGVGSKCEFFKKFLERHPEITVHTSIQERYDIYNKEFYEQHKEEE